MKKILISLTIIAMIFSAVSCSTEEPVKVTDPNAGYSIEKIDGEYYLIVDTMSENESDDSSNQIVAPFIKFDSVSEMRDNIINGKLTDEQKKEMERFRKGYNGYVEIMDFSKLGEPKVPDDLDLGKVKWKGSSYIISVSKKDVGGGFYRFSKDGVFEKRFQEEYVDYYNNIDADRIIEIKEVEDRNATVIEYKTDVARLKSIRYTIDIEGGTLKVDEQYTLENSIVPDAEFVSETYPGMLHIYGDVNGCKFYVQLYGFDERPTVEFLSGFSAKPIEN